MRRFITVAFLPFLALVGCGGSEEDNFKLVKVTGTVTKEGQPLAKAKVSFLPDASNRHSTPGVDQTGTKGTYMVTFKGRTGVGPGKYKVIITPPVELPAGADKITKESLKDPLMIEMSIKAMTQATAKGKEVKKQATESEFDCEVEDKASGVVLDFDVKS